jgi:hypothetical protein
MVAPTGVNEDSPQEPMDAALAHAELTAEDHAEGGAQDARAQDAWLDGGDPEAAMDVPERAPGRDMGPLALVGIVVGVIALVAAAAGVLAVATHGFHRKTVVTYRPAAVFKLHPGECVNSAPNGLAVTVLACGTPHDAEVFATFALPVSGWPGNAVVQQDAGNGCAARLGGYLKPALASAGLAQEYVYPNQVAWQAGERAVVCEVSSPTGKLTGSVRQGS